MDAQLEITSDNKNVGKDGQESGKNCDERSKEGEKDELKREDVCRYLSVIIYW